MLYTSGFWYSAMISLNVVFLFADHKCAARLNASLQQSICSFVCCQAAYKTRDVIKTEQLRAMISIDDRTGSPT